MSIATHELFTKPPITISVSRKEDSHPTFSLQKKKHSASCLSTLAPEERLISALFQQLQKQREHLPLIADSFPLKGKIFSTPRVLLSQRLRNLLLSLKDEIKSREFAHYVDHFSYPLNADHFFFIQDMLRNQNLFIFCQKIQSTLSRRFLFMQIPNPLLEQAGILRDVHPNRFFTDLTFLLIMRAAEYLRTLENIDLRNCQLKEVPAEAALLTNAKRVDLSYNHLQKIPRTLCQFFSLQILNLSYNPLQKIPARAFSHMTALHYLNLSNTSITELPEDFLDYLPDLTMLDLAHTKIRSLPDKVVKKLKTLPFEELNLPLNLPFKKESCNITCFLVNDIVRWDNGDFFKEEEKEEKEEEEPTFTAKESNLLTSSYLPIFSPPNSPSSKSPL